MKEFDALRERYDHAGGSSITMETLKADFLLSPILREIRNIMAAVPTILHLGQEKKTFLFQDRDQKEGQVVAVSADVSDEELRMITVILLEHAREYYEHMAFHQEITGLTGDILLRFAIKKYRIPVNAYFNLSRPDIYPMGDRDTGK